MRLFRAEIPTILQVGNHDVSPSVARAHAMEEFSTLQVPHVLVVDKPVFLGPGDLKPLCAPGKELDLGLFYPGVFDHIKASNRGGLVVSLLITTFTNLPFNRI